MIETRIVMKEPIDELQVCNNLSSDSDASAVITATVFWC